MTQRTQTATALLALSGLACAAIAAPPGDGWRLAFVDEFVGNEVDRNKWGNAYPWGNTHNHEAYMLERNVAVRGGHLEISAYRQWWEDLPYISGAVHSSGRFHMTRGYVEGSFRMPTTIGSWPAFWMLQSGWPPEIDILEVPLPSSDKRNDFWVNYHYTGNNGHASFGYEHPTGTDLTQNWKTYGMHWRSNGITWYLDDGAIYSFTNDVVNQSSGMYLIINYAVGGWPGSPPSWPTNGDVYECDWVRVWQQGPDYALARWRGASNSDWKNGNNWLGDAPRLSGAHALFPDTGESLAAPDWGGVIMLSGMDFTADTTRYVIGSGNEQIIAHNDSGTVEIKGRASTAIGHELNCSIDLYSDLLVSSSGTSHLFLDGKLTGRGDLELDIPSGVWLRGLSNYLGTTTVRNGELRVLGGLYQSDATPASSYIEATDGAAVLLRTLDRGGDTGYLSESEYAIRADNGTFQLRSDTDTGRAIQVGPGGMTLEAYGSAAVTLREGFGIRQSRLLLLDEAPLTLTGTGTGTIEKLIDGTGPVTKQGDGTWTLAHPGNSYDGATTIEAGTLIVSGAIGQGALTVHDGATLAVHADAGPLTPSQASFEPGAALAIILDPADELPGTRIDVLDSSSTTGTPTVADAPAGLAWDLSSFEATGTALLTGAGGPADYAAPFGTIDDADTTAFLTLIGDQSGRADFNNDGAVDFFDVLAYLAQHDAATP